MVQFPHSSSVQSKLLHQVCYEHLEHLYLKDDAKRQSWVEPAASSFHQLRKSSGSKTQFESSKSTCKCICTPSRKPSREVLTLTRKVTAHATAWKSARPRKAYIQQFQVPKKHQKPAWTPSSAAETARDPSESPRIPMPDMLIKCWSNVTCCFSRQLVWVDTQPAASLAKPKAGSAAHCSAFGAWSFPFLKTSLNHSEHVDIRLSTHFHQASD